MKACQTSVTVTVFAALLLLLMYSVPLAQQPAVEDETCLGCHEDYNQTLERTAHRLSSNMTKPTTTVACMSCHSGAEIHIEDPSTENIGNPSRMLTGDVIETCTSCHPAHMNIGTLGFDPHMDQDMSCTSCHKVHTTNSGLLVDDKADFCGRCHVGAANQFHKRSNHPMTSGNVSCISCHQFVDKGEPDFGFGSSANCYSCHPEQSGPYLYEHEATSSFSPEGEGCTSCHAPHGSSNESLLTQPGDRLCRQCHGVLPNHVTRHDGIAVGLSCFTCHSELHGSNFSKRLLNPDLETIVVGGPGPCFDCHNLGH